MNPIRHIFFGLSPQTTCVDDPNGLVIKSKLIFNILVFIILGVLSVILNGGKDIPTWNLLIIIVVAATYRKVITISSANETIRVRKSFLFFNTNRIYKFNELKGMQFENFSYTARPPIPAKVHGKRMLIEAKNNEVIQIDSTTDLDYIDDLAEKISKVCHLSQETNHQ